MLSLLTKFYLIYRILPYCGFKEWNIDAVLQSVYINIIHITRVSWASSPSDLQTAPWNYHYGSCKDNNIGRLSNKQFWYNCNSFANCIAIRPKLRSTFQPSTDNNWKKRQTYSARMHWTKSSMMSPLMRIQLCKSAHMSSCCKMSCTDLIREAL